MKRHCAADAEIFPSTGGVDEVALYLQHVANDTFGKLAGSHIQVTDTEDITDGHVMVGSRRRSLHLGELLRGHAVVVRALRGRLGGFE